MQKIVTLPSEFSEIRGGLVATDGGFAITTTLQCIDIPFGADWLSLTTRNFSENCATVKFAINPYLTIIATTDALATSATIGGTSISGEETRNISAEMQDGDTTDFAIDSFPIATNGGYVYVGSPIPFRGAYVDIGTDANATGSVITVKYPRGETWTDISDTDATISGGASMALDGTITWTVPTTWQKTSLVEIGDTTISESWSTAKLYWTRWEWSVALDTTDIVQLQCLNRSTNYAQLIEHQSIEQRIHTKASGISVGNIEALTNAGTANLVVNAAAVSFGGTSAREVFE